TLSMWNQEETSPTVEQPQQRLTDYKTPMSETLRQPRVWLSVLLFLFYTGAEVTLGTWVYTLLTESRGVDPTAAGFWTGSYWAMFTVGRVLAGLYTRHVRANTLVRGSLSAALGGVLLLLWNPAPVANLIAVAVCGFAIAPIFPALVSGTSQRVGERFAANTIGMQIAGGGLGGAIVPAIAGVLARQFSLEVIPLWLVGLFVALLTVFQVLSRQTGKSARSNA
ncbi:MAG TPA: MFS transporter, partial [Anaerolineae bacterium]|nr:MFS transporter [Anaerolineae bacterium]